MLSSFNKESLIANHSGYRVRGMPSLLHGNTPLFRICKRENEERDIAGENVKVTRKT